MNKTKEVIKEFMGKTGHHETTVHESVEPAIKREVVKPTEHEEVNTAINKEVHQDHYHRTVQPVQDKEVLPEQHTHRVGAVQEREYDHRDHENTKRALATENEKFRDERVVHDATHTQSRAPTVQGENVHHHVHETIQPVIHKETIQPSVVHTTIPVHETHHNPAQHHSTTSLPPVSIDEYKRQGGALGGRSERFDAFEGEPKSIHGTIASLHNKTGPGLKEAPNGVYHGDYDPLDGGKHHASSANGRNVTGTTQGRTGVATESTTGHKKEPSLLNKLNPTTDSNGDGKAGFMK